ncbi:MAG: hypothetical protein PHC88_01110 [Terrimicrobiaceae bacterium]|nr:hypothetical protein [Terrimicrobiaceae bacterium]
MIMIKSSKTLAVGLAVVFSTAWLQNSNAGSGEIPVSASPSLQELTSFPALPEGLIPVLEKQSQTERNALGEALREFQAQDSADDNSALEKFAEDFPNSSWTASVWLNLGQLFYNDGEFTKALAAWKHAWELTNDLSTPEAKRVGDFAIAKYSLMLSRLGRKDELTNVLGSLNGRSIADGANVYLHAARDGLWMMNNKPEVSFRCGPEALASILRSKNKDVGTHFTQETPSATTGFSLTQVAALADKLGMNFQMAKRAPGATVIVPSVVNWKVGHYGAIVAKNKDRYLMVDPTFGTRHWITASTLDQEASGYFLIPAGKLPDGWTSVDHEEAKHVFGKGYTSGQDGSDTKNTDVTCQGCPTSPMAQYQFFAMTASLTVGDTPVSYKPAFGPDVTLRVNYNQVEADQPASLTYTNFSSQWECSWASYLEDSGTTGSGSLKIQLPGGGAESYTYNSSSGKYLQDYTQSPATLQFTTSPVTYTRTLQNGASYVYSQVVGSGSSRRIFLSKIIDPVGSILQFQYDAIYPSRINRVYDATVTFGAASNYTQLEYNDGDPYRVTKVRDRFSRYASFVYSTVNGVRRLQSITDPVLITSSFEYNPSGQLTTLTTPYGKTSFIFGDIPGVNSPEPLLRWVQAKDPYGAIERVEFNPYSNPLNTTAPTNEVPTAAGTPNTIPSGAFVNSYMQYRDSFYWTKKQWMEAPGDYTKAHIYHWLHKDGGTGSIITGILESEKDPLESRIWYYYDNPYDPPRLGPVSQPKIVARTVEDASGVVKTQATLYEYNAQGNVTKITDPKGRETDFLYLSNGIDVQYIKQKTASGFDTVAEFQYDTGYPNASYPPRCPKKYIDASGQPTTFTYDSHGRVLTILNALNETTQFIYQTTASAADYGKLKTIIRPNTAETLNFAYDSAQRIYTKTNSDNYILTYFYDNIDRPTKIQYPDTSSENFTYDKLDLGTYRDRSGTATIYRYNALRRMVAQIDALNHTNQYKWCKCGSLDSMIDGNGHTTQWNRDIDGRVVKKIYADTKSETSTYESLSGRLSTLVNGNLQTKTYHYNVDNTLASVAYSGGSAPGVSWGYDTVYKRVTSMLDGSGTTNYTYVPVGTLGALKLFTEDGPLDSGTSDKITYTYDAIGRSKTSNVGSAGTENKIMWYFDNLSRLTQLDTNLGSFTFPVYDGTTNRIKEIDYPNGTTGHRQSTTFQYFGNSGDRRLSQILNLSDGANPSSILSKFDYVGYSLDGRIKSMQTQLGASAANQYTYGYDGVYELTSAIRKVVSTGTTDKTFSYGYDKAWNRTSEQRDSTLTTWTPNSVNQLVYRSGGGKLLVAGHTNEAATVTVQGAGVPVDSGNNFSTQINASGTMTLSITATDYSPNHNTTPIKHWLVSSSGASTATYTYDNNGNLLSDGTKSYEWDAENRLTKITVGSNVYEFAYDGFNRRVSEKLNGSTTRTWIWSGLRIVEERNATGTTVTKRFYPLGEQWIGGSSAGNYFYTRDHLGSVREMTNSSTAIVAQYDYDPYGRITKLNGTLDATFLYTGHFYHQGAQLTLAPYRAFDAEVGRWLSRDPSNNYPPSNLYCYCYNSPITTIDRDGRDPVLAVVGGVVGAISGGFAGQASGGGWGALTGAIAGGIGGLVGGSLDNPVAGGFVSGALSSLIGNLLNGTAFCNPSGTVGAALASGAIGAAAGAGAWGLGAFASHSGISTEIENAVNLFGAAGTGFVGGLAGGFSDSLAGTLSQ